MVTVGGVLSTVKVALGPEAGAGLPPRSLAVPAARLIPRVPSPVRFDRVIVRVVVPVPLTTAVPLAVPVLFRVTSPFASVTESVPMYVIVYVMGPVFVRGSEGALMDTVTGVYSKLAVMVWSSVTPVKV